MNRDGFFICLFLVDVGYFIEKSRQIELFDDANNNVSDIFATHLCLDILDKMNYINTGR